jgi:medium-chain acyl-[acyl-carrier-protein] hydrolase
LSRIRLEPSALYCLFCVNIDGLTRIGNLVPAGGCFGGVDLEFNLALVFMVRNHTYNLMGQPITQKQKSLGFAYHRPNPQSVLRVFCFPYAGSGIIAYRNWAAGLPLDIEICPIQLPGRGHRIRQPLFTECSALVTTLENDVKAYADKPFVFFGHSMGALLAFEVARRLGSREGPLHLFVSGRSAPQIPRRHKRKLSDLPDGELLQELRRLDGTPSQILARPEMVKEMLPVLRADFSVVESYSYQATPPLTCPISAYAGSEDAIIKQDVEAWSRQTTSTFSFTAFPGGHFFIQTSQRLLLEVLRRELSRYTRQNDRDALPPPYDGQG